MAALTYYWVGSTAASMNSFNWDVVGNWKTLKLPTGGSGGTLATLVSATRTPFGTDTVNFGRVYTYANQFYPAPFQIHSPCLFGGVTTDGTPRAWAGTTAGSTITEKYSPIYTHIRPSYPFTKLGGQVSSSVLTEMTRAFEFHRGEAYGTRGEWTRTGEEGESGTYWENRLYSGAGFTSGISFSAQPHYTLRLISSVADGSKLNTTVALTGVTAGLTSGGVTAQHDGSSNAYSPVTTTIFVSYGSFTNVDSITAYGWSSGTPTVIGESYRHGAAELYGNWNSVRLANSVRDLDLTCIGVKVNAFVLEPTQSNNFVPLPASGYTTSTSFDIQSIYFDKDSSARYFGIKNIDQMNGDITIHGDVTPTGGFICAIPLGASQGNSGGIILSNGSFTFTPPNRVSAEATTPTVHVGFPLSAGTKQSTTLTNAYFNAGGQPSVLAVDGNFTSTNCYINEGTMQFSTSIPVNATVDISNLQLNGTSVLDMSVPALFTGTNNIKVISQSDAVTIKPGKGTAMTVSQTAVALTS